MKFYCEFEVSPDITKFTPDSGTSQQLHYYWYGLLCYIYWQMIPVIVLLLSYVLLYLFSVTYDTNSNFCFRVLFGGNLTILCHLLCCFAWSYVNSHNLNHNSVWNIFHNSASQKNLSKFMTYILLFCYYGY